MTILRRASRLASARSGIAATELALTAPLVFVLLGCLLDFGRAYVHRLRVANAATAAASYALEHGAEVTASTFDGFVSAVTTVASESASFPTPPAVTVAFNGSTTSANVGTYYCATGSPPVFAATGSSSVSCGSVTSGKFVTVTVTSTFQPVFLDNALMTTVTAVSDSTVVRVQ